MNTFRFLFRYRLYTLINLFGLVFSLTGTTLIVRYLYQELTVDHFIPHLDRTYQLMMHRNGQLLLAGNTDPNKETIFVDPMNHPSVEKHSSYIPLPDQRIEVENRSCGVTIFVADSLFFDLTPYPVVSGQLRLERPTDVILTLPLARKLFGDADPLGRTLGYGGKWLLTVVGVIDQPSTKARFNFDLLLSSSLLDDWPRVSYTVFRVFPGSDMEGFNRAQPEQNLRMYGGVPIRFESFPFKDLYMSKAFHDAESPAVYNRGNPDSIAVLSIVALLLLAVGVLNYINIYTVMMAKRAREFGIRKVYGAGLWPIFRQLFLENGAIIACSLLLMWFFIEISGGFMERLFDVSVRNRVGFDWALSLLILGLVPAIATLYPLFKYRYAPAITSLRAVGIQGGSVWLRALFLWIQYVITLCLIIVSLFFVKQLQFMLDTDPGYRTQGIVYCRMFDGRVFHGSGEEIERWQERISRNMQWLRSKLSENPLFELYEFGPLPTERLVDFQIRPANTAESDENYIQAKTPFVTARYMKLFGMQLAEGRFFNDSTDGFAQYKCMINETAARALGIKDLRTDRVQTRQRMWWNSSVDSKSNPPYEVVGIVKDFTATHLSMSPQPMLFCNNGEGSPYDLLIVSVAPGREQEAIEVLTALNREMNGADSELECRLYEEDIRAMYREDRRVASVYVSFAALAILISCVGLFGLSLFDIRQRYREIALRKVNGASGCRILLLLLRKYLALLALAYAVAVPVSYVLIHLYLARFAHKAPVSVWLFVVAGAVTLLLTGLTLAVQVRKAARINPARVLNEG